MKKRIVYGAHTYRMDNQWETHAERMLDTRTGLWIYQLHTTMVFLQFESVESINYILYQFNISLLCLSPSLLK